jgi:hypothetical protein
MHPVPAAAQHAAERGCALLPPLCTRCWLSVWAPLWPALGNAFAPASYHLGFVGVTGGAEYGDVAFLPVLAAVSRSNCSRSLISLRLPDRDSQSLKCAWITYIHARTRIRHSGDSEQGGTAAARKKDPMFACRSQAAML